MEWKNNSKCAVMFSFDLDSDTTWRNGNDGYPNGEKYIKSLSIGQYGPKKAVKRILALLKKYNIKATFFIPGKVAEDNPELIKTIDEEGHEIGHHGYIHERFFDKTVEEQIEIIEKTQEIYKKLINKKAKGFRTPSGDWSIETPKLLYERGFLYSSSMRGDDRPYKSVIENKETNFIEIPTRWELDDYVAMAYNYFPEEPSGLDRISGYEQVLDNFIREFDGYYKYGLCFVPMMHPQVIGTPGHIQILENLIKHITEKDNIWITTGSEIADWCIKIEGGKDETMGK